MIKTTRLRSSVVYSYLHGKHPAGRLPERVPHGHLQALQIVVLDDKSQDGPLEVPLSFTEGAVG